MNLRHTLRAALVAGAALAAIGSAHANNFDHATYSGAKSQLKAMYKAERDACDAQSGNAKDICVEIAKGREKVALAQLEYNYTGSDRDGVKVYEAEREANYAIAKERCDDQTGNAKDVCVKEAKAERDKAKADLKLAKKVASATASAIETHMKADYKVAREKCDALDGNDKNVCVASAKAWYHESW